MLTEAAQRHALAKAFVAEMRDRGVEKVDDEAVVYHLALLLRPEGHPSIAVPATDSVSPPSATLEVQDVAGSTPAGVSTVAGSRMLEGEWGSGAPAANGAGNSAGGQPESPTNSNGLQTSEVTPKLSDFAAVASAFDTVVNASDDHTGDRDWLRWQLVAAYESGRRAVGDVDKASPVAVGLLSWRDVFDTAKASYGLLDKAISVAVRAGYRFVAWNDRVYDVVLADGTWTSMDLGSVAERIEP